MQLLRIVLLGAGLSAAVALTACGGDDDSGGNNGDGGTPTVTIDPQRTDQPDNQRNLFPPLEGPERPVARDANNYWEDPEYALPDPQDLPDLPGDLSMLEPPDEPVCPDGWDFHERPLEGFKICYPELYAIEGHGFVTAGVEPRWYAVGFFDFRGDVELGHVSIYVTGPSNQPFLYVAECSEQAYRVTIDGVPASVCPHYRGVGDEKIIAYHIRTSQTDYFVNVVPAQDVSIGDPEGVEATLLQIVHTFDLLERPQLPTPTPAATAEG